MITFPPIIRLSQDWTPASYRKQARVFSVLQHVNNTSLLGVLVAFSMVNVLHHYKKFLAMAGIGAGMMVVGLALFKKTAKEEKHHCCH